MRPHRPCVGLAQGALVAGEQWPPWVSPLDPLPSGATCEVVLAPCASRPCRNGGECKASEDYESFSCACPAGWQGEAAAPRTCSQAVFQGGWDRE